MLWCSRTRKILGPELGVEKGWEEKQEEEWNEGIVVVIDRLEKVCNTQPAFSQ